MNLPPDHKILYPSKECFRIENSMYKIILILHLEQLRNITTGNKVWRYIIFSSPDYQPIKFGDIEASKDQCIENGSNEIQKIMMEKSKEQADVLDIKTAKNRFETFDI